MHMRIDLNDRLRNERLFGRRSRVGCSRRRVSAFPPPALRIAVPVCHVARLIFDLVDDSGCF